ncbi:class I SAM-dependent methyltransferase [Streptomyces sp. NPDC005065]|uniref:O-methyltransferase n=1 Tax=Streptomyces sp. NPDC005065 TaxID=3154461 RepID=UPI0033A1F0AC
MIPPKHADITARVAAYIEVAEMQVPHAQAVLLTLLTKLIRATTVVEIGTFTGYSTLCLAAGLAPGGTVTTCDLTSDYHEIAVRAWEAANLADRIHTVHGPAARTLRDMPSVPHIDLAFIDADKTGYVEYWDLLLPRIRPGGLVLADNVLYAGEAAAPEAAGNAAAIRAFNRHVHADTRVEGLLIPVADGMTIARKKEDAGDRRRAGKARRRQCRIRSGCRTDDQRDSDLRAARRPPTQ